MIDSGIRRGTDVMKCLAFGASMVVVTRPLAWALHTNGYEGCKDIINILNDIIVESRSIFSTIKQETESLKLSL